MSSAIIQAIAKELWTLKPRFHSNRSVINFDGKHVKHGTNKGFSNYLYDHLTTHHPDTLKKIVGGGNFERFTDDLWNFLWLTNDSLVAQKRSGVKGKNPDVLKSFHYSNCVRVRDIVTGREIIYNTGLEAATELQVASWEKSLTKEERNVAESTLTVKARLMYDPYLDAPRGTTTYMGQEVQLFNTYVKPYWKSLEVPENPKLNKVMKKYLTHLFPNKSSRDYVLDWMYNMMVSRNHTYLTLNSNMGTGKNTLVEIMKQLVGMANSFSFSIEYFDSRFNSEIMEKRLVFLDEVPINEKTKDKLKYMVNDTISIEAKGMDPMQVENYASFVIASNHDHNVRVVPNDRRFSVPEITDVPLKSAMDDLEIAELYRYMKSDEFVEFAHWILNRGERRRGELKPHLPYKGEKFYHLCHESMPEYMKFIIDRIKSENKLTLDLSDLRLEYKLDNGQGAQFGGVSKIKALLTEYLDRDKEPYATVIRKSNGDGELIVNSKYVSDGLSEEDEDEDLEDMF